MSATVFVKVVDGMGRTLLVENKEKPLPNGSIKRRGWGFPGGGLEQGETLQDAGVREVFEETGYSVYLEDEPALAEPRGDGHVVYVFRGYAAGRFGSIGDEILGVRWCPPHERPSNMYRGHRRLEEALSAQQESLS